MNLNPLRLLSRIFDRVIDRVIDRAIDPGEVLRAPLEKQATPQRGKPTLV